MKTIILKTRLLLHAFPGQAAVMLSLLLSIICPLASPAQDGTLKWAFPIGIAEFSSPAFSSPAIGADGTIYVSSPDEKFYAINPNGTQKWAFPTWDSPTFALTISPPAIGANGTIYVGAVQFSFEEFADAYTGIYAINPDGTGKWDKGILLGDNVTSTPAIGVDGTIYLGSGFGVHALNPNGTDKWGFGTYWNGYASPAIGADGTIYVGSDVFDGSDFGKLHAINPNGTQKWAFPIGIEVFSSPAIGVDGTIYVGSGRGVFAINPNSTQKWVLPIVANALSSPAIGANGTIYVGSGNAVVAINPNGTQKWAFPTSGDVNSSPAIGPDGTLYVVSEDGNLYAISTSSGGLANSAWPMIHHDPRHTGFVGSGPVSVNHLLHFQADKLVTTYDPTPVPNGPAGTYVIVAKFDNTSDKTIAKPIFHVIQLSGGNLLLNADGGPGGVGATMTPPGSLTTPLLPGQTGTYQFRIGLQKLARFDFLVSMLGQIE